MKVKSLDFLCKCFCAALLATGLAFQAGCEMETEPGGPGADGVDTTQSGDDMVAGDADNTFTLTVPYTEVDVTQGGTQTFTVGINRGTAFSQAVDLMVTASGTGVTVEPAQASFGTTSDEQTFTVKAAADAPIGDTTITIVGKPATGKTVEQAVTVHVNESGG